MKQSSICVFCGSRVGNLPDYEAAAKEFGGRFATNNWRLVYGAGDVGLMGAVARAAQDGGAETFGVIPTHLLKKEVGKTDLTRFVVTENMHERKKVMFMNSDAAVILPGGPGTLDEFFEVLTWRQLGLHVKPIVILNIQDYWTPLLDVLKNFPNQGFADESILSYFTVVTDVEALETALKTSLG